jgi:hypothetical protein
MSNEERTLLIFVATYNWKFLGQDRGEALANALKTIRLIRPDHPNDELRTEARRTFDTAVEWFKHFGDSAKAAADGFAQWMLTKKEPEPVAGTAERPFEAPPPIDSKDAFDQWFAKFRLTVDDLDLLLVVAAFAWKHIKQEPGRAVTYAMQTAHLLRHGSPESQADAKITADSAKAWAADVGETTAREWGGECMRIAQGKPPFRPKDAEAVSPGPDSSNTSGSNSPSREQLLEWGEKHASGEDLHNLIVVKFILLESGMPPDAALAYSLLTCFHAANGSGHDRERGQQIIAGAKAQLAQNPTLQAKYEQIFRDFQRTR